MAKLPPWWVSKSFALNRDIDFSHYKEVLMQYKSLSRHQAVVAVLAITAWMAAVGSLARAALLLTGPLNLSHNGNLVQNGSFEDHPDGGVTIHYWAAGTTSTPIAQPANWVTNGAAFTLQLHVYTRHLKHNHNVHELGACQRIDAGLDISRNRH